MTWLVQRILVIKSTSLPFTGEIFLTRSGCIPVLLFFRRRTSSAFHLRLRPQVFFAPGLLFFFSIVLRRLGALLWGLFLPWWFRLPITLCYADSPVSWLSSLGSVLPWFLLSSVPPYLVLAFLAYFVFLPSC